MTIELIAVNGVLLISLLYMVMRRFSIERALKRQVDEATGQLKGKAGEKMQTLTFREQQNLQLNMKRTELARIEKRILMLETEIRNLELYDYRVVHALSEPSRDHQLFYCTLAPNPFAERTQKLSEPLERVEHFAIIAAESDAAAKRMVQVHFPERGPLRSLTIEMARPSTGG